MARKTPAARALVGALALADGVTTNQAFHLAGYRLSKAYPSAEPGSIQSCVRLVVRPGITDRVVARTLNARQASDWLFRLGRKLEALGVGKAAA